MSAILADIFIKGYYNQKELERVLHVRLKFNQKTGISYYWGARFAPIYLIF
jgi:hypothetical protein